MFIQIWNNNILSQCYPNVHNHTSNIMGHGIKIWVDADNKTEYLLNNPIGSITFDSSNISYGDAQTNYSCAMIIETNWDESACWLKRMMKMN